MTVQMINEVSIEFSSQNITEDFNCYTLSKQAESEVDSN